MVFEHIKPFTDDKKLLIGVEYCLYIGAKLDKSLDIFPVRHSPLVFLL